MDMLHYNLVHRGICIICRGIPNAGEVVHYGVHTISSYTEMCKHVSRVMSHIKVYKCIFIVSIAIYKVHVGIWMCIKGIWKNKEVYKCIRKYIVI